MGNNNSKCRLCSCLMPFDEVSEHDITICIDCEPDEPEAAPYEINTEIVFSTGHITENDDSELTWNSFALPNKEVTTYHYEYGFRVWADPNQEPTEDTDLSASFWELFEIAKEQGCKWLVLDVDGATYENLEQFDW